MRISDWSSDVCSSDLVGRGGGLLLFVLVLLEAGTGGLGADLAVAGVLVAFHLIGGRVLREHRLKVENLAKLQIGRASCRARVCQYVSISVVAVPFTKNTAHTNQPTHTTHQNTP